MAEILMRKLIFSYFKDGVKCQWYWWIQPSFFLGLTLRTVKTFFRPQLFYLNTEMAVKQETVSVSQIISNKHCIQPLFAAQFVTTKVFNDNTY